MNRLAVQAVQSNSRINKMFKLTLVNIVLAKGNHDHQLAICRIKAQANDRVATYVRCRWDETMLPNAR